MIDWGGASAVVIACSGVIGTGIAVDAWRRNRHLTSQDAKLEQIHVLVNSRLSEALDRIAGLESALHDASGVPLGDIQDKETQSFSPPPSLPQSLSPPSTS